MLHAATLSLTLALAGVGQPPGNLPGMDTARTRQLNRAAAGTNQRLEDQIADDDAAQARYEAALREDAARQTRQVPTARATLMRLQARV